MGKAKWNLGPAWNRNNKNQIPGLERNRLINQPKRKIPQVGIGSRYQVRGVPLGFLVGGPGVVVVPGGWLRGKPGSWWLVGWEPFLGSLGPGGPLVVPGGWSLGGGGGGPGGSWLGPFLGWVVVVVGGGPRGRWLVVVVPWNYLWSLGPGPWSLVGR